MKAILFLKADTEEDEELMQAMLACHFQTNLQDFLEDEAYAWSENEIIVSLPGMTYIDREGNIIGEVLQDDGPILSEMR